MGECLYYLPGIRTDIDTAFIASGLSDRLDRCARTAVDRGPDDKGGMLIAGNGHRLLYKADEQTWAGPFNEGRYWIGLWDDAHPGPVDLARSQQIAGTPVTLLDGNDWLIPAWRMAPMALTMGNNGEVQQEPLPLRLRLHSRIEQIAALFESSKDTTVEFDLAELLRIIADVLSVNYRTGTDPAEELTILRLVSTDNFREIVNAVLDIEFLKTAIDEVDKGAKKNGAD